MSSGSATLKASLQADPAKRNRFAAAINFNTPANRVARHGSISARTIFSTASAATTISIHVSEPKTIWRYGVQKAARVWRRRAGRKQRSFKTISVSRAPSRLSVNSVRRDPSVRAPPRPRTSSSRTSTGTEPQSIIKRTTLILTNPTHEHSHEVPDLPTPRTADFRGSVNPSSVHDRRSGMTRDQSDRRLDGLPPSLQVRGSSGTATQSNIAPTPTRPLDHQPTVVTPRPPFVPAQAPFRADSLRGDLNRCSGLPEGPEDAWARLHQSHPPEVNQADFERWARHHAGHHRPSTNKPLPSAPGQSRFVSFQPGRQPPPSHGPFLAERPLPTPLMPASPPPAPPTADTSRARQSQYQSYHSDMSRDPAAPAAPFIPNASMPPTPCTPQPPARRRNNGKQPGDPNFGRATDENSAGPSRIIRENHQRQSQAYDNADLDKMDAPGVTIKPHSIKRKPLPPQTNSVRRSRLQADLPAVPEVDTPVAESSSAVPDALRPAARPVSTVTSPMTAPTAAPATEVMNGLMQAVMQLTGEMQSLQARLAAIEEAGKQPARQ